MAQSRFLAWQLWFHYALLEAAIVFFLWLGKGTSYCVMANPTNLFLLYLVIALGDQAIHLALEKTTGWKD